MPASGLRLRAPILAGTVASITGQAASTGVVLAALSALGASQAQIVAVPILFDTPTPPTPWALGQLEVTDHQPQDRHGQEPGQAQ